MSEMTDLYQEVILDHAKRPRRLGVLDPFDGRAHGFNPLCGDRVVVTVRLADQTIDLLHEGEGCAISRASASLMAQAVEGKTVEDFEKLFTEFRTALLGKADPDEDALGSVAALLGVREHPSRIKCALLPWHALNDALKNAQAEAGNA